MEIRNPVHPKDFVGLTMDRFREEFLIQNLFVSGEIKLVYSHFDRMIVDSACPTKALYLEVGKELGSDFFLQRRDMGVINVGAKGHITAEGDEYALGKRNVLYMGKGSRDVIEAEIEVLRNPIKGIEADRKYAQQINLEDTV